MKVEKKALNGFADRFTTCSLNPDIAAKFIDVKTSLSEGLKIVEIAKETQKHHRTEICKLLQIWNAQIPCMENNTH